MLNKLLISLLSLACIAMGFCFGAGYIQETFEPQQVEKIINTLEVRTQIVEVEKEVIKEVEVEVEVIVEKPIKLREFESLKELREWLVKERANRVLSITFTGYACDDAALNLQHRATESGYLMSVQIDTGKRHALNSVFIGNEIYFLEPQSDEVWLVGYRD